SPLAVFLNPPLTEESSPLAVLPLPPLTEEKLPLAVLLSPPLTEANDPLISLKSPTKDCDELSLGLAWEGARLWKDFGVGIRFFVLVRSECHFYSNSKSRLPRCYVTVTTTGCRVQTY